ncbi:hypothetical protein [Dokdonella sp.]|uniref:hypothetical protein n=1 Tax=Dokdonella sp. TaxID=2291710 RepID=UPI001B16FA3F|nr:hypothetical protein [Dokdonella sp.]MBO9665082.1 hypothetical protein [Dokdonella sp.]
MIRNCAIPAALGALLSIGPAAAVSLNPKGLGQALIYPYYTVNNHQDTLLSVINTGNTGKALKVRFLEGYNGRPALDFLVFLAPLDTWVAAVSAVDPADPTSGAKLVTNDNSCIDGSNKEKTFVTYGFDGQSPGFPADGGPQDIARVREGYFEIVTLGDVDPASDTSEIISPSYQSGQILPPDCSRLNVDAALADLIPPNDGLMGSAMIVNAGDGIFYSYNASALTGFTDRVLMPPEDTLAQANSAASRRHGAVATISTNDGSPLTLDYDRGIDAVSAALMADTLYNEFLTASSMGANTDWVVTFPTKAFYVDKQTYPSSTTAPFFEPFTDGRSRATTSATQYDRKSQSSPEACEAVPGPSCLAFRPFFEHQVNVVGFLPNPDARAPSGVLGSHLTAHVEPFWEEGWMRVDLATHDGGHALSGGRTLDGANVQLNGLPVVGFMAYNVINTQAQPGKLSNYSGTFEHRSTIDFSETAAPAQKQTAR